MEDNDWRPFLCFTEFIGMTCLWLGYSTTQCVPWFLLSYSMFCILRFTIVWLHFGIPWPQSLYFLRIHWFGTSIEWAFFYPILWLSWSGTNTIFMLLMWMEIMDDMGLPTFHFFHPEKIENETSFARDMESMFKYGLIPVRA